MFFRISFFRRFDFFGFLAMALLAYWRQYNTRNMVRIEELSPYVSHVQPKQEFHPKSLVLKETPAFVSSFVRAISTRYTNITTSINNKYNATKFHLVDERGAQRISAVIGVTVLTSIVGRNIPHTVRIRQLNNMRVNRLSPVFTGSAFIGAMLYAQGG